MKTPNKGGPTKGGIGSPPGYGPLTPLFSEQHGALTFRRRVDYGFARGLNAAPIAAEEAGRAQAHYPILFAPDPPWQPVALFAPAAGQNDFVDDDGRWRPGAYVPAFIRRYPFVLMRESAESDRMLLCADLAAPQFAEAGPDDAPLFEAGAPSRHGKEAAAFCERYEQAMAKTRRAVARLEELKLFDEARAAKPRPGGQAFRIEGFKVVSEERLRALDDATLAGLTRAGLVGLIAAHHFSLARLAGFELETV